MEVLRICQDAALYYLTFSVVHWLPVFVSEEPCLIITESLNFCHREKGLRTNAFVIMPTHMHLIGSDADFDVERLSQTLTDMRKYTGQRLADYCERKMPTAFGQMLRGTLRTDRARQFWQPSRHPEAIWSQAFWQTKMDYLHDNPRRKGLVRDATHWRFSSAAYWLLDPPGESDVVLTAIEW
jgi:REP element-mobilizing transposase RayT